MRYIIIRHADACIASSTKAKEKLLHWGVPERKIFLSLLTVDISRFRYAEKRENQYTLLFVGENYPPERAGFASARAAESASAV